MFGNVGFRFTQPNGLHEISDLVEAGWIKAGGAVDHLPRLYVRNSWVSFHSTQPTIYD
jgi:hypothetical protein